MPRLRSVELMPATRISSMCCGSALAMIRPSSVMSALASMSGVPDCSVRRILFRSSTRAMGLLFAWKVGRSRRRGAGGDAHHGAGPEAGHRRDLEGPAGLLGGTLHEGEADPAPGAPRGEEQVGAARQDVRRHARPV